MRERPADEHATTPLEDLVALALERMQDGDLEAAARRACAGAPERVPEVVERLARLERVGLLHARRADGAPRAVPGYELLEPLGSGGMAVVYAARERATGAIVALKTADPRVAWTERGVARFRREIDAATRLSHPRVVRVRGAGEVAGVPFYAMDLVPGATLGALCEELRARGGGSEPALEELIDAWRRRAAGGALPRGPWGRAYVEAVARVALDVAEALAHVHAHGIVHRDVKPSNVLVDAEGRGNLFDLGLAHLVDDTRLTQTGDFAGSPHYAAPEQVAGSPERIDARTDVYGLGATLFEALALRPPFQGRTTSELLQRILRAEAPPLRQVAPWAPPALEAIVRACLEKDPRHRYASAADLAADLRRFLGFQPVRARGVGPLRRAARFARRNPAIASAYGLAATILVGAPLALALHLGRVAHQRDLATAAAERARREADENREVSAFLESLVLSLDAKGGARERAVARALVDEARTRIDAETDIQPLTRASLMFTVGRVLAGMRRELDAIPLFDRSLSLRSAELGDAHPDTLSALAELASTHLALGDHPSARALAERCLGAAEGVAGGEVAAARARAVLGRVALEDGDAERAHALFTASISALRGSADARPADLAGALSGLARLFREQGAHDAAETALAEAERLVTSGWEPDYRGLAEIQRELAAVAQARGDDAEAAVRLDRALQLLRKGGAGDGPDALAVLERLVPLFEGRLARGEDVLAAACAAQVALGECRAAGVDSHGAGAAFERAVALGERVPEPDPDVLGRAYVGHARALFDAGRLDDAARAADAAQACSARRGAAGGDPSDAPAGWEAGLHALAPRIARARGDAAAEQRALDQAGAWLRARAEAGAPSADLARRHALLLFELDRAAEAEPFLLAAEQEALRAGGGAPLGLGPAREEEYEARMQRAITLLQTGRNAEAAAVLEDCALQRPRDPLPRYNLACAHARAGERERALAALEAAVELGYAYRERAAELTAADPDLEPLRADSRFDLLVARMRAMAATAEEYASRALEHAPPGVDPDAGAPLLVVLHKNGETKEDVVAGRWRDVARELGCVLLAPSGRVPSGARPEEGMLWIDTIHRYAARSWYFERPVLDALAEYHAAHDAAPEYVLIAGEEYGGTLAFHLAVRSPQVYRGCLLVDAAVPFEMAEDLEPVLGTLGLRVALIGDRRWRPPGALGGETPEELLVKTFRRLNAWGLETTVATREEGDSIQRLVAGLRFVATGRRP